MEISESKRVCSALFSTTETQCTGKEESLLRLAWLLVSLRTIEMWCWSWWDRCLWSGKTYKRCCTYCVLHTVHSSVYKFITDTQIGEHKRKVNNVSLCTVMEYLPFNKEGIRLKAWAGKGKANMTASPFSLAWHSRYATAQAESRDFAIALISPCFPAWVPFQHKTT